MAPTHKRRDGQDKKKEELKKETKKIRNLGKRKQHNPKKTKLECVFAPLLPLSPKAHMREQVKCGESK